MAIFRYVMYVLKMWFKQVPKHPYVIAKWSLAATNIKLRAKILRLLEIDSVNLVIRTDEVIILSSLIALYQQLGSTYFALCLTTQVERKKQKLFDKSNYALFDQKMKVFHGALFEVVEVIDVILDQWVKNCDFRSEKLLYQQFNSTLLFQRYQCCFPPKGMNSRILFFFSSAHEKIHVLLL